MRRKNTGQARPTYCLEMYTYLTTNEAEFISCDNTDHYESCDSLWGGSEIRFASSIEGLSPIKAMRNVLSVLDTD